MNPQTEERNLSPAVPEETEPTELALPGDAALPAEAEPPAEGEQEPPMETVLLTEEPQPSDDVPQPQQQRRKRTPLTHYTAAKVTAFILFILMVFTAAGSVFAAFFMVDQELYTTPEDTFREETFYNMAYSDAWNIAELALAGYDPLAEFRESGFAGIRVKPSRPDAENYSCGDLTLAHSRFFLTYEGYEENGVLYFNRPGGDSYPVTITVSIPYEFPAYSGYDLLDRVITAAYALRYWIYAIIAGSVILAVACFVFLMCASGRRRGHEEAVPGWGTKVPFDLLTAAGVLAGTALIYLADAASWLFSMWLQLAAYIGIALTALSLLLGWCMSFALRIKLGGWWKNTLVFYILRLLWKFLCAIPKALRVALPKLWHGIVQVAKFFWKCFRKLLHFVGLIFQTLWRGVRYVGRWMANLLHAIPLVWKTALILVVLSAADWFFIVWEPFWHDIQITGYDFIWIFLRFVVFAAVIFGALMLKKLQQGGEKLAEGDLSYQVDTEWMFWDFKRHGENLNRIGEGMTAAVEQRMKSERMKTELITNVSHDIKTPLTSIINYADLIGKEPCDNEKITEYAEVLHRQSERLKRLIEDLVEASKASTGNLDVFLAPCEAGVLLTQAAGEYEQRLHDGRLELVLRQPEHPVKIMADGRRLWRVIDNLMNNICKYAMSGTRVYLTLEEREGRALISFKNTSREALNLPSEELLERFVQGDAARKSDGNGLGLSIAKSLTELQNGTMTLTVDGDLFKVVLSFPTLK